MDPLATMRAQIVLRIRPLPRDPPLRLRAIAMPIFMETAKPAHAQHVRMVARSRLSLMQMTLPPLIVHVQPTRMQPMERMPPEDAPLVLITVSTLVEPLRTLNAIVQPTRMQPMERMPKEDVPLVTTVVIRTVPQV